MGKKGIRNLGKLLRKDGIGENFGKKAYLNLEKIPGYKDAALVMIYLNLPAEAPTDELVELIRKDGKKLCTPVTEGNLITPVMIFDDTTYKTGAFGVREPEKIIKADIDKIDIVITPGLLFDKTGSRCGYGKGCYDLFFQKSNTIKVGLSFDKQLISAFPTELHDVKMDYIVTEKGLIACEKQKEIY